MRVFDIRGVLIALFVFCGVLNANVFFYNDDKILSDKVILRLSEIATELYDKAGIYVGAGVFNSLDNQNNLQAKFDLLHIKSPYAFIMIVKNEKKVEIFADENTSKLFDKEAILSPFPERGTILPILASKNGKDIFNAAIMNGYADLSEQIAKSKDINLISAIGNANKDTLNIFRFFIYGSVVLVFALMIYKKRVKR